MSFAGIFETILKKYFDVGEKRQDRFDRAVKQLSQDTAHDKSNGVVTLNDIAHESRSLRKDIIRALCLFVRQELSDDPPQEITEADQNCVQSALNVIGDPKINKGLDDQTIDLSYTVFDGFDFSEKTFDNGNFLGTSFRESNLTSARFKNSAFNGQFSKVEINNAVFDGSTLIGASFSRICGSDISFARAEFSGVQFFNAELTGTTFKNTRFYGENGNNRFDESSFMSCNFNDAVIENATIYGSNFSSSTFENVDLTNLVFQSIDAWDNPTREQANRRMQCNEFVDAIVSNDRTQLPDCGDA